ncbi:hypothetical protein ABZ990_11310 [Streptomyces sp. NPDC046203]|uniref:hypothetical protein n=1 Tax=Streptomyces sp. NPDC046203 TaxID=3154602 RepID=UPI0033CDC788
MGDLASVGPRRELEETVDFDRAVPVASVESGPDGASAVLYRRHNHCLDGLLILAGVTNGAGGDVFDLIIP